MINEDSVKPYTLTQRDEEMCKDFAQVAFCEAIDLISHHQPYESCEEITAAVRRHMVGVLQQADFPNLVARYLSDTTACSRLKLI